MLSDPTYWLLGLPFDAIGMDEAVQRIRAAVDARRRLVVITPNVNFVSMATGDAAFRNTLLESQLSLVDGMPLVWYGRRQGIPFPGRVAGSSLLLRLAAPSAARPLRVHFYGGEPGAAERAAMNLPSFGGGLASAGFTDPGFGSLESMGSATALARINDSGADLLVLALGAKKGHQWIARFGDQVNVPVISHLGAAVNFIAGTVRRAPGWVQHSGLEWIWRMLQEPRLVGRYWSDGWMFLRLLAGREAAGHGTGAGHASGAQALAAIGDALQSPGPVRTLDVAAVGALDPRTLGLLYAWRYRLPGCGQHVLTCSSGPLRAQLVRLRADCLLSEAHAATTLS